MKKLGAPVLTPSLLVAFLLIACGGPPGSGSGDEDGGGGTPVGAWVLTEGSGPSGPIPMVDDSRITMTIQGDQINGTAACNSYGGKIAINGNRLRIGDLAQTLIGCIAEVAESEAAYMAAIARVTGFERDGDTLTLGGPDVRLTFRLLPPVPQADIVGTMWVLETVVTGDAASSVQGEATLALAADGTFSGLTGCRSLAGRYLVQGDEILFTELRADGECPASMEPQDSVIVSVLGDGFTAVVEGDAMTLTAGGQSLVYRAAPGIE